MHISATGSTGTFLFGVRPRRTLLYTIGLHTRTGLSLCNISCNEDGGQSRGKSRHGNKNYCINNLFHVTHSSYYKYSYTTVGNKFNLSWTLGAPLAISALLRPDRAGLLQDKPEERRRLQGDEDDEGRLIGAGDALPRAQCVDGLADGPLHGEG